MYYDMCRVAETNDAATKMAACRKLQHRSICAYPTEGSQDPGPASAIHNAVHAGTLPHTLTSRCRSCGEIWLSAPLEFYTNKDSQNVVIADALALGRYDEAIALYISVHWHKVEERQTQIRKQMLEDG